MTRIRAVLFDFGGVITTSPFDAFARYEADQGLPDGFLRGLNAANPHDNAWARLERRELTPEQFARAYEQEAAAAGHRLSGTRVLELLRGEIRPAVVEAVRRCRERLGTALLTNNFIPMAESGDPDVMAVVDLFHVVVESALEGIRKPDPAFYRIACERLGIEPHQAVFLDDLGVNLKPAREMGMTTIKVTDQARALDQLEAAVGFPIREIRE